MSSRPLDASPRSQTLPRQRLAGIALIILVLVFLGLVFGGIVGDSYGASSPYIVLSGFAVLVVGLAVLWRIG